MFGRRGSMLWAVVCLTVGLTAAGCGGPTDGFSGQRGTVTGTVTIDGQPLPEGCSVLFMAASGGYTGSGPVGSGGAYSIFYKVSSGLPVGAYLVQISPPGPKGESTPTDPVAMGESMRLSKKTANKSPVPTRYASTGTSGLTFTVQPGANQADFALTTEAAEAAK